MLDVKAEPPWKPACHKAPVRALAPGRLGGWGGWGGDPRSGSFHPASGGPLETRQMAGRRAEQL